MVEVYMNKNKVKQIKEHIKTQIRKKTYNKALDKLEKLW